MLSLILGKPLSLKEVLVIELSSYQLEDLDTSPHIAVVTNLFPEHMDHHGGLASYYAAKKNITRFQTQADVLLLGVKNAELAQWARETRARVLYPQKKLPLPLKQTRLIGEHNASNIRLALACAKLFGVTPKNAIEVLQNFQPLPHRMQKVGTFSGITFYDDAISTTPESTIAALQSLPKISTLFLGGQDRGYDFSNLEAFIRKSDVKNIVLFPDTGNKMFRKVPAGIKILRTGSMKDAVRFAYDETSVGRGVLLSTASPSYSLWKNFEVKGKEFQKFVRFFGHTSAK